MWGLEQSSGSQVYLRCISGVLRIRIKNPLESSKLADRVKANHYWNQVTQLQKNNNHKLWLLLDLSSSVGVVRLTHCSTLTITTNIKAFTKQTNYASIFAWLILYELFLCPVVTATSLAPNQIFPFRFTTFCQPLPNTEV